MTLSKSYKYYFFIITAAIFCFQTNWAMQDADQLTATKNLIVETLNKNNCLAATSSLLPSTINADSLVNFLHGISVVRATSPELLQDGAAFKIALKKYYDSFFDQEHKALVENYSKNYHTRAQDQHNIIMATNTVQYLHSKNSFRTWVGRGVQCVIVGALFFSAKRLSQPARYGIGAASVLFVEYLKNKLLFNTAEMDKALKEQKESFNTALGRSVIMFDTYKTELPTLGYQVPERPAVS